MLAKPLLVFLFVVAFGASLRTAAAVDTTSETLAGIRVGAPVSAYPGLQIESSGKYGGSGSIGTIAGKVSVQPCGGAVYSVSFLLTLLADADFAGAITGPGARYSADPVGDAAKIYADIGAALRTAGWIHSSGATLADGPLANFSKSGLLRTLGYGCDRSLTGAGGVPFMSCTISLATQPTSTCTSGL